MPQMSVLSFSGKFEAHADVPFARRDCIRPKMPFETLKRQIKKPRGVTARRSVFTIAERLDLDEFAPTDFNVRSRARSGRKPAWKSIGSLLQRSFGTLTNIL
jgi:hypothetical protein